MLRKILLKSVVGAVVVVGGCGWMNDDKGIFVDRRDDYVKARQLPPLEIPEDLHAEPMEDPFPIPPVPTQPNAAYFVERAPLPEAIYTSDNRGEVRIQRLSQRRWLAIPESPTTVWPKVKQFLAENRMAVTYEEPAEGRIDTDWFEVAPVEEQKYRDVVRLVLQEKRQAEGLKTGKERLRLRLEGGLQDQSSEIHLREENDSRGVASEAGLASLAKVTSTLPSAEDELLKELGAYIAARVSEQTVSRVASNILGVNKAQMDRGADGSPVLRLRLDFERAWAAVNKALENGGVEVTSDDSATGTYEIRVSDAVFAGEEPGFFKRMISFGRNRPQDLKLQMEGNGEEFSVLVQDENGQPADKDLAQQVLALIREFAV